MRAQFRVFAFLLLAIGLMAGCLQSDAASSDPMLDVPEEVSGEDSALTGVPIPGDPPLSCTEFAYCSNDLDCGYRDGMLLGDCNNHKCYCIE